jgi:hypothetical protein
LVAWTDSRDGGQEIFGARLDLDAGRLDGTGFAVTASPGADFAAVASDGQGFLVAWSDPNISSFPLIRGTRMTSAGQTLDLRDGGLAIGTRCGAETLPALGVYQGEYAALWEDHCTTLSRIFSDRVINDGGLVDQPNFDLATIGASFAPAATSSGSEYFLAWANGPASGPADIYFAWYLNTSPAPGFDHHESFFLAQTPQDEEEVAIASNAQNVVLVGYASRLGTEPWRIRARWVNGPGIDAGSVDAGSCAGVAPPPSNNCSAVGTPIGLGALLFLSARGRRRSR